MSRNSLPAMATVALCWHVPAHSQPLRVICGHASAELRCPLFPRKQTCGRRADTSAKGQQATWAWDRMCSQRAPACFRQDRFAADKTEAASSAIMTGAKPSRYEPDRPTSPLVSVGPIM